jgi:hypothetical protein
MKTAFDIGFEKGSAASLLRRARAAKKVEQFAGPKQRTFADAVKDAYIRMMEAAKTTAQTAKV